MSGFPVNSSGIITVALPPLESGFKYDSYLIIPHLVASSSYYDVWFHSYTIASDNRSMTVYVNRFDGSIPLNANLYMGFTLFARKPIS